VNLRWNLFLGNRSLLGSSWIDEQGLCVSGRFQRLAPIFCHRTLSLENCIFPTSGLIEEERIPIKIKKRHILLEPQPANRGWWALYHWVDFCQNNPMQSIEHSIPLFLSCADFALWETGGNEFLVFSHQPRILKRHFEEVLIRGDFETSKVKKFKFIK
jgi:hypothetical protein